MDPYHDAPDVSDTEGHVVIVDELLCFLYNKIDVLPRRRSRICV